MSAKAALIEVDLKIAVLRGKAAGEKPESMEDQLELSELLIKRAELVKGLAEEPRKDITD